VDGVGSVEIINPKASTKRGQGAAPYNASRYLQASQTLCIAAHHSGLSHLDVDWHARQLSLPGGHRRRRRALLLVSEPAGSEPAAFQQVRFMDLGAAAVKKHVTGHSVRKNS
jgi:hypothetical protein